MSRGLGTVQRFVLNELSILREQERASGPGLRTVLVADELAHRRTAADAPTRSDIESVRRAIRKLSDSGLVEAWYVQRDVEVDRDCLQARWKKQDGKMYKETRHMLGARLPLDPDEQTIQDRAGRLTIPRPAPSPVSTPPSRKK